MSIRLLDVSEVGTTQEFVGSEVPRYAILSHTWEDEEVIFRQLGDPKSKSKKGYLKIEQTCALAATAGLGFAWVDTCCIDKSSSAELSEAINSMFHWYQQAEVCYVYLSDLSPEAELLSALPRCRWFTRGWTLQELIAPRSVSFYDSSWKLRGNKEELSRLLEEITTIPRDLLLHIKDPSDYPVARRMSWASRRYTTRIEDMSYCLLGLFDVHMSPRYGERTKAFARLQHAILIQSVPDATLFAWTDTDNTCPSVCGIMADSPRRFMYCGSLMELWGSSIYHPLRATVLETEASASILWKVDRSPNDLGETVMQVHATLSGIPVGISVRKIGPKTYARSNPGRLVEFTGEHYIEPSKEPVTLANTLPKRYPFYFREDPILGYRFAVLMPRVVVSERLINSEMQFIKKDLRHIPFSNWDHHDALFISTESTSLGWSIVSFQLQLVSSIPGDDIKLPFWRENFSAACFRWNTTSEATLAIIRHDPINPVNLVLLESQLESLKFGSARGAEELVRRLCGNDLESSVTMHIPACFKNREVARKSATTPVVFSLKVKKEARPDLCYQRPINVLEIKVGPLSEATAE
ncbi:heterokaryon incompatibility protein-domain-containing protein [Immersiella caudata]|uniref:Heterokaryon incompatibility protein-domain-containing protein n=1 Tax=Immersiella caudata TaxID=314043 RepID=A0AA39WJT8_9PEZI|nr:heterokaryon incompatibility protein-domain-containing protein [Immersiella caudata]